MNFTKASAFLAGSQSLNILFTLVSRVVLTRLLGDINFGQFTTALNSMTLLSRSCGMGLAPSIQFHASGKQFNASGILGTAIVLTLILSLLSYGLTAIYFVPLTNLLDAKHPDAILALRTMLIGLPIVMFTMVLGVLFVPLGLIKQFGLLQAGALVPMVLLALAFSRFFPPILAACYAQLVTWICLSFYMIFHLMKSVKSLKFDVSLVNPLMRYSLRAWPNSFLMIGIARFATLIGAIYMNKFELSYFALGLQLTEGLLAPHQSLGQLILSRSADDQTSEFDAKTAMFLRISGFVFCVLFLVSVVFGYPGILLLFGSKFIAAYPYLLALFLTGSIHALMRVYNNFSAGKGLPQHATVALGVELAVLLVVMRLFGPIYGSWGVVVASACSAISGLFISAWQFRKLTDIGFVQQFIWNKSDIIYLKKQVKNLGKPSSSQPL